MGGSFKAFASLTPRYRILINNDYVGIIIKIDIGIIYWCKSHLIMKGIKHESIEEGGSYHEL